MKRVPATRLLVDFHESAADRDCAMLGAMGFSTKFIMKKTGLSQCQVTYRLAKAGLIGANNASRMDFRNGDSPFSQIVLSNAKSFVARDLERFLKRNGV